ncbi:hypothetical protein F5Y18DRAFT_441558 [Xylariaceae sp. FL1019]|nr:hypothetical protein F5Y18DRAFT_441558 [Xylariaceae sp. FL1019]
MADWVEGPQPEVDWNRADITPVASIWGSLDVRLLKWSDLYIDTVGDPPTEEEIEMSGGAALDDDIDMVDMNAFYIVNPAHRHLYVVRDPDRLSQLPMEHQIFFESLRVTPLAVRHYFVRGDKDMRARFLSNFQGAVNLDQALHNLIEIRTANRTLHHAESGQSNSVMISNLPRSTTYEEECPICLLDGPGRTTVRLPCSHRYCEDCVEPYLRDPKNMVKCPYCRVPITALGRDTRPPTPEPAIVHWGAYQSQHAAAETNTDEVTPHRSGLPVLGQHETGTNGKSSWGHTLNPERQGQKGKKKGRKAAWERRPGRGGGYGGFGGFGGRGGAAIHDSLKWTKSLLCAT